MDPAQPAVPPEDPRRDIRIEIEFLESVLVRLPGHRPVLEALGNLYTQAGRYEDGLRLDLQLTALEPAEPLYWYNLACSQALLRDPDGAIHSIERAVGLGYQDFEWLAKDPDLESIRHDPRLKRLLGKAENDS